MEADQPRADVWASAPSRLLGFRMSAPRAAMNLPMSVDGKAVPLRVALAGGAHAGVSDGAILSPMPGKIVSVAVEAGQTVVKGQTLLTLEAMKMEHALAAPFDGVVAELSAVAGGQVSEGVVLAKLEPVA